MPVNNQMGKKKEYFLKEFFSIWKREIQALKKLQFKGLELQSQVNKNTLATFLQSFIENT